MQIAEIESKWRDLVNKIYGLQEAVAESLRQYEKLSSRSQTQEELEDYAKMLTGLVKVIDGD